MSGRRRRYDTRRCDWKYPSDLQQIFIVDWYHIENRHYGFIQHMHLVYHRYFCVLESCGLKLLWKNDDFPS